MKFLYTILILLFCSISSAEDKWFSSAIVDATLPAAYQVAVVDINNDGKPDIAALGEGKESGVFWYENPSWHKWPITDATVTNCIDLAFHDLDKDGQVEMALAFDFNLGDSKTGGNVWVMKRRKDINLPWNAVHVGNYPTSHRLRWTSFIKDNVAELWVLPILGIGSKAPEYNQEQAPMIVDQFTDHPMDYGFGSAEDSMRSWTYPLGKQPPTYSFLPGLWSGCPHNLGLHVAHGIYVDQAGKRVLTASEEGITAFWFEQINLKKKLLCTGNPKEKGRPGCSEIAMGKNKDGVFLATIEPWHGNLLAVYHLEDCVEKTDQSRLILEDSFDSGHAVAVGDFDKDGEDEILAGYRGSGHKLYLYDHEQNQAGSKSWKRYLIDDSVAVQGIFVSDINQDGWLDFAATGGSTHNVKMYINCKQKK